MEFAAGLILGGEILGVGDEARHQRDLAAATRQIDPGHGEHGIETPLIAADIGEVVAVEHARRRGDELVEVEMEIAELPVERRRHEAEIPQISIHLVGLERPDRRLHGDVEVDVDDGHADAHRETFRSQKAVAVGDPKAADQVEIGEPVEGLLGLEREGEHRIDALGLVIAVGGVPIDAGIGRVGDAEVAVEARQIEADGALGGARRLHPRRGGGYREGQDERRQQSPRRIY